MAFAPPPGETFGREIGDQKRSASGKEKKPPGRSGREKLFRGLEGLRRYALEIGFDRALPTRDLAICESARAKCCIPACKFYGSSIIGWSWWIEKRLDHFKGREEAREASPSSSSES